MREKLIEIIKSCKFRRFSHLVYSILYAKSYKSSAKKNGVRMKKLPVGDYRKKWSQLAHIWETTTYKYYANYTVYLEDIVPESIGRTCIEYVLNPKRYRAYYADKNMFARICGKENVPRTIVCRVFGGGILGPDLKPVRDPLSVVLKPYDKVILKPSIDSMGGHGVMLFHREGENLKCGDVILTEKMLFEYNSNFSVQEVVEQHKALASLNPTSVNTVRVAVYRSPINERVHVVSSILRVGCLGMFVDNACSGGKFAGVDVKTGKVSHSLCDASGGIYNSQNGIDFSTLDFTIPGWEIIKAKCVEVAEKITHHRLIAFDMTITNEMRPVVIEFNVESFSYWLFMYTNQKPLGEYTDEIIHYCKTQLMK